jgi:hypothetical protein
MMDYVSRRTDNKVKHTSLPGGAGVLLKCGEAQGSLIWSQRPGLAVRRCVPTACTGFHKCLLSPGGIWFPERRRRFSSAAKFAKNKRFFSLHEVE